MANVTSDAPVYYRTWLTLGNIGQFTAEEFSFLIVGILFAVSVLVGAIYYVIFNTHICGKLASPSGAVEGGGQATEKSQIQTRLGARNNAV